MPFLDLATQVNLTWQVTVSPTAARQFAAIRHSTQHIRSGVLFGRWPYGTEVLSLEAATAGGPMKWRRHEADQPHPFTIQPDYVEGLHDMLCAQPGLSGQRVGYWAALPRVLAYQPHTPALNATLTHGHDLKFLKSVADGRWLIEPQVVVVVREHDGRTEGNVYAFDPLEGSRQLEFDPYAPWPPRLDIPFRLPEDKSSKEPPFPLEEE